MFELIKQGVDILDVIEKDTGVILIQQGENYVIENERDVGGCPFCGHNDCFKIKYDPENTEAAFYHCFSCEAHGDVIGWRAMRNKITMYEAALGLAKDFNIEIPHNYDPNQELFRLAARYYHNGLIETCNQPQKVLGGKTPLEYQVDVRQHKRETLDVWSVGFSDGYLTDYLESLGIDPELINNSGLTNAKGKDLIPRGVFVYPHLSNDGRVSHFTLKDPSKKHNHQMKKKFTLNGVKFYGQHTLGDVQTVVIVEGENDALSLWEIGKAPSVLASIGQLSAEQLEWMKENLSGKNVVTIFDNDEAGDKYRIKVEKLRSQFKNLAHIHPGEYKDVDDAIKAGVDFEEFVKTHRCTVNAPNDPKVEPTVCVDWDQSLYEPKTPRETQAPTIQSTGNTDVSAEAEGDQESFTETLAQAGLSVPGETVEKEAIPDSDVFKEIEGLNVVQKGRAYYKILVTKDGDTRYKKLTDFILELKDVYLTDDEKSQREVIIIREDGRRSKPFFVDSDTKVKVPAFKVMMADRADASFNGTDEDLSAIWALVFLDSNNRSIRLTQTIGYNSDLNGWVFNNAFISNSGKISIADKSGVCWVQPGVGIRPLSLELNKANDSSIPSMSMDLTGEGCDSLISSIVKALSDNRKDAGQALTLLAWTYSCVYSNLIFDLNKGFPFLFLWGLNGKGKTTIARWLQDFFGMRDAGYASVPQLGSGVGLRRKVAYYSSLPVMIDEIRANKETEEHLGTFRSYYDRTSKSLGVRESFGVKSSEVRSTFIFVGEDQFEDQATRERCISLRIAPTTGTKESYEWLEDNRTAFTNIARQWIVDACFDDSAKLIKEIKELDHKLVNSGCTQRSSKNWAAIGIFGMRLAEQFMPDFDYFAYLVKASTSDKIRKEQETTLNQFFELIEAVQAQENTKLTNRHIMVTGKDLHIWFPATYKIIRDEERGRFPFSKSAVMSALREEAYFKSDDKKVTMGMDGVRRVVVTLDLTTCPEIVKNIAFANN